MRDGKAGGLCRETRSEDARGDRDQRRLGTQTQKRIGLHLRAMYDTVVQQPVPDRFKDLIAQLDRSPDLTDGDIESPPHRHDRAGRSTGNS